MTRQAFVASLRRKSSGFSRGASIYRGVTRFILPPPSIYLSDLLPAIHLYIVIRFVLLRVVV
jgi:hypothetical protein